MSEELTRAALRHQLIRARNARIAEDRLEDWPDQLWMHPFTVEDLQLEGGFETQHLMDFEGKEFMDIPIVRDTRLEHGVVEVHWPEQPAREEAS